MKLLQNFCKTTCILLVSLQGISCGLLEAIGDLLTQPNTKQLNWSPPQEPRTPEPKIEPTKFATPEETVFNLAPRLQSLYAPNYQEATENFFLSPLSACVMLAQVLIGTRGWHHDTIAKLLDLEKVKPKSLKKRNLEVLQQSGDPLYDSELHHAAFHSKLNALVRNARSDQENDMVALNYAFFYKKGRELIQHFRENMEKIYVPTIPFIPIDMDNLQMSKADIDKWGNENGFQNLTSYFRRFMQPKSHSLLISNFYMKSEWKVPLEESPYQEDFNISPNRKTKVNYLKGIITQALYVDSKGFTLVRIPLNHADTYTYILLPKGGDSRKYNIRILSNGLNFKNFVDTLDHQKVFRNVRVKVPNVFTHHNEFDIIKPLLQFINDANTRRGKPDDEKLMFNGAAKNFKIDNLLLRTDLYIKYKKANNSPPTIGIQPNNTINTFTTPSDVIIPSEIPSLPNSVILTQPQNKFNYVTSSQSNIVPEFIPDVNAINTYPVVFNNNTINTFTTPSDVIIPSEISSLPNTVNLAQPQNNFNSVTSSQSNTVPEFIPDVNAINTYPVVFNTYNQYPGQVIPPSYYPVETINPEYVVPNIQPVYYPSVVPIKPNPTYSLNDQNPTNIAKAKGVNDFPIAYRETQDIFPSHSSHVDYAESSGTKKQSFVNVPKKKPSYENIITNKGKTVYLPQRRVIRESVMDFEATRPFLFIIVKETLTKLVLVWGSVSDPNFFQPWN